MDVGHYVDIYATKGVEYLILLVYLGGFVLFMRALNAGERKRSKKQEDRHEA